MTVDVLALRAEKTKSYAEVPQRRAQHCTMPQNSDKAVEDLYNTTLVDMANDCNTRIGVANSQSLKAQDYMREVVRADKERNDINMSNQQELIERLKREATVEASVSSSQRALQAIKDLDILARKNRDLLQIMATERRAAWLKTEEANRQLETLRARFEATNK